MNRLAFGLLVFVALFVSPLLTPKAYACSCILIPNTAASALSIADTVFAGRVLVSDRFMAQFEVDKVWKGQERSRITMLTGARDMGNGIVQVTSCDFNYIAGQKYVVYASGAPNALIAAGCSRTAIQSDSEIRGLDAVIPHKRVSDEAHSCVVNSPQSSGEIRVVVAASNAAALPAVTATVDGVRQRYGAITDASGRATFSELSPGEYKITADLDGYAPKQFLVTVPATGCIEASLFLLRAIQ